LSETEWFLQTAKMTGIPGTAGLGLARWPFARVHQGSSGPV